MVIVALRGDDLIDDRKAEVLEFLTNYEHFSIAQIVFSKDEGKVEADRVFEIDLSDGEFLKQNNFSGVELMKIEKAVKAESGFNLASYRNNKVPLLPVSEAKTQPREEQPSSSKALKRVKVVPRVAASLSIILLLFCSLGFSSALSPMVCLDEAEPMIWRINQPDSKFSS